MAHRELFNVGDIVIFDCTDSLIPYKGVDHILVGQIVLVHNFNYEIEYNIVDDEGVEWFVSELGVLALANPLAKAFYGI